MDATELQRRFPELEAGVRPWRLFAINGCGLSLLFGRDHDAETGTYVKTLCLTILWVPVFPVSAYRVADAPTGGWYVLGRVPPSRAMHVARRIGAAVVLAAAAAAAWQAYTTTDAYKDGVELARAHRAAAKGRLDAAANRFQVLADSRRDVAGAAREGLRAVVESISSATPPEMARTVLVVANRPTGGEGPVVPDLWRRATVYASDPARLPVANQVEILESYAVLAPDEGALAAERRRLVERGAAASPPDIWAVSELAVEFESRSDAAGAEALLAPHAERLGDTEGARILGQIRAAQARFEEAFPLLNPYVTARLDRLHTETEAFQKSFAIVQQDAIDALRRGHESEEWYERFEQADESARSAMVAEVVARRVEEDADFTARRTRYREAARVVPVAMDLGIVRMQRSRSMSDAAAARRELEEAERVFTAIDGVAAGDPDYELAVARVSFWLGKKDACEAHLAAALATAGGTFDARAKVALVLASLGEQAGARSHWEAAYAVATNQAERSMAAYAVSANTPDDPASALAWVRKADASDPTVAAATAACEGRVAALRGDLAAAERALAASLAAYDRLQRNSVNLNNAALAAAQLSALTGRVETLVDAGRRLRDALAEMPSNVTLLSNAAQTLASIGWVRGLDGEIDLRFGIEDLCAARYDDSAGREAIRAAARASEEMREAQRLFDRGIGLVPGNAELIRASADLADDLGDEARLRDLAALVTREAPDTERGRAAYVAASAHVKDRTRPKTVLASVKARMERLGADASPRDRALVEVAFVQAAGHACMVGVEVDLEALDARARRLHAEFPCSATRTAERITAALIVHRALAAANARYAREAERTIAFVGTEPLIAEALYRDAALRDVAGASSDFARLVDLLEESDRKFPGELAANSRALLWLAGRRPLAAPGAQAGVEPGWALPNLIEHATAPFGARTSLSRAWVHRIAGRVDLADAVLSTCVRLGGEVPYME